MKAMQQMRRNSNKPGFLQRLRQDARGNTLAVMAAALIPLLGFTGASVDMARLYVVKVRLQQACDAGVLAGRKFMVGDVLDAGAKQEAQSFFQNNFRQGWFQTKAVEFDPKTTDDGQLEASAKATVPLAIMQFFGGKDVELATSCQARLDIPDLDVMFVLDTTGSMACTPARSSSNCSSYVGSVNATQVGNVWKVPEENGSRISALRLAVVDFYDTLKAAADPSTHIRYGFVPYTSTVNVGYIIPQNFLVTDTWTYQSRRQNGETLTGSPTNVTISGPTNSSQCTGYVSRSPGSGFPATRTWGTNWNNTTKVCTGRKQDLFPLWRYEPVDHDISEYVKGNVVVDPTKYPAKNAPRWAGCIEERQTTASSSFSSPYPADLDIDLTPSSRATRWRPMWPSVIYDRSSTPQDSDDQSADGSLRARATPSNDQNGFNVCTKEAQRLDEMTRQQVFDYVNAADFTAHGGTYHDVGLIWGARFVSPTGPFADDTSAWPNRNPPNRHIIFMTDGDMAPNSSIYGLYGFEKLDTRVTGGSGLGNLTDRHNARFSALCDQAKAKNITIWVVAFAQTMTTRLQNCASPGKAYYASSQTELRDAFRNIASRLAELRITK